MSVVTPDLPELFDEAFERAGLQMTTGYDLKTVRRSLNLLTLSGRIVGLISGPLTGYFIFYVRHSNLCYAYRHY